jgi:hypothetical protein
MSCAVLCHKFNLDPVCAPAVTLLFLVQFPLSASVPEAVRFLGAAIMEPRVVDMRFNAVLEALPSFWGILRCPHDPVVVGECVRSGGCLQSRIACATRWWCCWPFVRIKNGKRR